MHCYFYCSMFILMSEKRQLGQQLLLRRPRGTGHSNFVLKFARHYVLHDFYNTHEKNYFLAYLRYHIICNRWVFGKTLLWEKDPLAMLCSRLYSKKERMNFILFKKVVRIGIAWFVTLLLVSFRRFQFVVLFFVYSVLFYLPR